MVNKAFANSAIMNSICSQLQQQADLIAEMQRMGVIPDTMANNLNEQLNRIYKSAATLTNDASASANTTTDTTADPSATPVPITIGTDYNDFIGSVLRSMSYLGDGPDGCTIVDDLKQVEAAKTNVQNFGSPIDMYSGYHTKTLIETTGYAKIAGYLQGKTAVPLKPFGDADNSTIKDLVAYINKLKDIEVYYVDANKVGDTKALQGLKTAMDGAKADASKANALASDYFIDTGRSINFTNGTLSADDAYYAKEISVEDGGHPAAKYKILLLDREKLLGAFGKTSNGGDITSGILIGNKFFVTRYPMAVFRGFERTTTSATADTADTAESAPDLLLSQSTDNTASKAFETTTKSAATTYLAADTTKVTNAPKKYIPVFTHPYFLSDTGYGDTDADGTADTTLKGSVFTGGTMRTETRTEISFDENGNEVRTEVEVEFWDGYKDRFEKGDQGTAETKCAYIDLYSGALYYKGESIGNASDFIGIGTADLESSVVIKPNTSVYIDDNNPTCITTVAQTNKYKPTETLQIGEYRKGVNDPVELPGASGNIMPVVFLMDYLELVYSPNTVGSDAFTAYGRKVRLDEKYILGSSALSASTGTIAYIVGEGATQSGWMSKVGYNALSMTDFLDVDGIYSNDASLTAKDKTTTDEPNDVSAAVHFISAGTASFEKAGTVRSGDASSERSDTLPQISAGKSVECVMMFGANSLDSADSSSDPKTPLYGITLYGGLYERGLFSEWINASGNANLTKWAKTIAILGYPSYSISNAILTEKIKGNYAFELNQSGGKLTIDLNTIVQINDDLAEDRRGGGIVFLRTSLLILGFVLTAYVSVLLAAWALDVNLDLGLNLLEKVSFGHFVAVRSLDEMPDADPDSTTTYVDFRRLIFRCIAFAAVGVILITIDPVNLIVKLLGWLNFVIRVLGEKLFGIKIM
jgi:hypothetical protein